MLSNRKKIPLDKTNVPVNTTTAATIKSKKSTKSKVQEKPIVKAPVKKVVTAKTTQKKKGKKPSNVVVNMDSKDNDKTNEITGAYEEEEKAGWQDEPEIQTGIKSNAKISEFEMVPSSPPKINRKK